MASPLSTRWHARGVAGRCGVIALIPEPAVIDKTLRHLRVKGRDARAGPWATGPPGEGATAEAA